MNRQARAVPADVSVHDAAERMLRERRTVLIVTSGGAPLGIITLEAVKRVPVELRARMLARDAMKALQPLSPGDDATQALRLLGENDVPQLPVADGGQLVGAVGRDDIARALELNELESTQGGGGRWPSWRDRDAPA
jgi:CBS domain-containing protein